MALEGDLLIAQLDGKIAEPDGAKVEVGFMGESTGVGLDTTTTR
jgi:hypothetical protein